ncbi:MAG: NADH:flavin oxidoreductase, partial [Gaiellaceae bacterium]
GKRGYEVVLAEATRDLGGRVSREARLPGLAAWIRVVDYRRAQLAKLASVEIALESEVTADEILGYGFEHVAVATGSRWRADGVGRHHLRPIALDGVEVLTPDELLEGRRPAGEHVLLYDDDHYYLGGVLAELLVSAGRAVTLVTPAARVSEWTVNTMEQPRIHRRLVDRGVELLTSHALARIAGGTATLSCTYTQRERAIRCDAVVLVSARLPCDRVAEELETRAAEWAEHGLLSVTTIGDAYAPSTIAAAVWDGRRYAEELDGEGHGDDVPFLREVVRLAAAP